MLGEFCFTMTGRGDIEGSNNRILVALFLLQELEAMIYYLIIHCVIAGSDMIRLQPALEMQLS